MITALNAELAATFPEPGANHFSLSHTQVAPGDGAFLIAYLGDAAVGCGAVRRIDDSTAELKRMYVDPSVRGRGIGRELIAALENEARQLGAVRVVLETGTRLSRAIRMYERTTGSVLSLPEDRSGGAVPVSASDAASIGHRLLDEVACFERQSLLSRLAASGQESRLAHPVKHVDSNLSELRGADAGVNFFDNRWELTYKPGDWAVNTRSA